MTPWLGFSLALAALAAFAAVAWSSAALWRLSPGGEKYANYLRLSCWRFAALEARLGPRIRPQLHIFRLGVLTIAACLLLWIVA